MMSFRELLLIAVLLCTGWAWCLKTTINMTVEATKVDYNNDGTLIAVTSVPANAVYVYETINYFKVFTYTLAGNNIRTARFSRDGVYLGVGFDDGKVRLIKGTLPMSSTALNTMTTLSSTIVDIDFNYGNDKLLVCYSDDHSILVVKNYALTTYTTDNDDTSRNQLGCKWSKNDDACFIDDDRYVKCYDVASDGTLNNNERTKARATDNDYRDLAVRPTTATPIKVLLAGGNNNDKAASYFFNSGTSNTYVNDVDLSFYVSPTDDIRAVCYAPDATIYAMAGYEFKVWIFNESTSIQTYVTKDSSNQFINCMFSPDSNYLAAGTKVSSSKAYVYIYHKTCFFCPPGYYQNTAYGCDSCTSVLTACSLCLNSTICTSCFQGYYFNGTDKKCYTCISVLTACSTCSSNTVCLECDSGYFLQANNTCGLCNTQYPGCLACNGTKCYLCDLDYFLNNGNCTTCSVPSCLRCVNSTTCVDCLEGYYLGTNGTSCNSCDYNCLVCGNSSSNCSACTSGYYLSNSSCVRCATNCLQCGNSTNCWDCELGYYSNNGTCTLCPWPCATCETVSTVNSTCTSCALGYYLLSNGSCSACSNNCSQCSNSTNCLGCQLGHYLTATNSCLICNSQYTGCEICSLGACYTCFEARYLVNSTACGLCNDVMPGCQLCLNSSSCLFCAIGYYQTGNTGATACARCPSACLSCYNSSACLNCGVGFFLNSTNSCVRCTYPCESCNSTGCLSCVEGYYVSGSSCANCTAVSNCLTCLNSTYCTSCLRGYQAENGSCWACSSQCLHCNSSKCLACNLGYYASGSNSCLPCSANCSLCTSATNCQSCDVGYFFNSSWTSNQCQQCGVLSSGCLTCNSSLCFHCEQGYYLSSGLCYKCIVGVGNCALCASGSNCTTCFQGYFLASATNCTPCGTLTGCLDCQDASNCTLCASGYYLQLNGTCSACPSNCTVCSSASACSVCAMGYFLQGSGCPACDDMLNGCSACSSNSSCLACSGGYLLNSSSLCHPCSLTLPACSLCSNTTTCESCQQGYFLNSSSRCQLCSSSASLEGCLLCNSSSNCQYCQGGYYLSGGSCLLCSSAIFGCSQCSNATACLDCTSGYYLNSTTQGCQLCSTNLTGCIFCESNETCLQCQSGYYLNGGVCLTCLMPGCEICNASDPYSCLTCNTGYFFNGTNCSACAQVGCSDCNSTACLQCETGYYLSGGSCLLCSAALSGCSKCSSNATCTECGSLFYLSGGSCLTCHSSMVGCSFCINSSVCLSCDGGYYLSGSTCHPCSDLSGCLICNGSSTCLSCLSGYLLSGSTCTACSTYMAHCYQCLNSTFCSVCESGYQLSITASGCSAIQLTSGQSQPPAAPSELSFKSFYVNETCLKHIFSVKDRSSKFVNVSQVNWVSEAKIYLENTSGSTLLTISSYELTDSDYDLVFYTNNPMTIQQNKMPVTNPGRILTGTSMTGVNVQSSFSLPQSVIGTVLPSVLTASDLVLSYDLTESEFYISYVEASYSLNFYLFGLIVAILLFVYGFCRATCLALYGRNVEIAGHIFALKSLSAVVFPTFAEYVNFCLGFMTVDLPWLNSRLPDSFFNSQDLMPTGYRFFFQNMNLAAMQLITCLVFLMLLCLAYCLMADTEKQEVTLKKKGNTMKNYKFKAFREFLMNFFCFGFGFAGFSAIVGTFLNQSSVLTANGIFYILGVILYGVVLSEAVVFLVVNKRIGRLRVILKATFLAAAGLNPLYLSAVAIFVDAILIIVEYNQRKKVLISPKAWLAQNFIALSSLLAFFFVPDSFLTIGTVITLVSIAIFLEVYQYVQERNESGKQLQFFEIEQNTVSDSHFWVLADKEKKDSNPSSEVDINENINEKESPKKESNFIFDLQVEENKEAMTTGFSTNPFQPKRRTRKFKQDRTQASAWSKAGTTIPEIFMDQS